MSAAREERRLAAIVIGDVVGYSRMMGLDEVGTMTTLKAHRRDLILPLLASYKARLVNTTGDAMLLEFGSAVDAVACAATLQRGMQARNTGVEPDKQIRFRLGVNLGDIVIDGDDIYGDGVNVAARLETLCEPGGLCVSRAVEEQVKDKLPYPFEDLGERTLKNIARPLRVYALTPAAIAELPEPTLATDPRLAAAKRLEVTPGATLNDAYEVDHLIGSGGMGEIFRGHEIHTGDVVAIKLIRLDMEGNEAALGLFQKEASILKHVYHEAVVRYYVFSFDQILRRHYLAMEFVDGPSLADVMKQGAMPVEVVDGLRRRVAAGLDVAHQRGIVHRDLSPDNIILPDGDVRHAKIIDFGIARSATLGGGTIIGGGFAGKFNYVSPEQLGLFGGDVTARSDIYSFGLVLAGALRGEPVDMGGSQVDLIEKRRGVPDLADLDAGLGPLIAAMLEPDPERRPASMAEVAAWSPSAVAVLPAAAPVAMLGPAVANNDQRPLPPPTRKSDAQSPPEPKKKRSLPWWIVGGAVVLALLWGGFVFVLLAPDKPAGQASSSPTLQADQPSVVPPSGGSSEPTQPVPPPVTPPVNPPPPSTATPQQRVASFLRSFDGGPCFFARAADVTETSAGVEAFAASAEVFDRFAAAFTKAVGFEPALTGNKVWSRQCPALDLMRQARMAGASDGDLFLKSTRLRTGQPLAGEVGGTANRAVTLLRVREDGSVENVSGAVKEGGDARSFDLPLSGTPGGPFPQLIVALSSPRPVLIPSGGPAEQVFPALAKSAGNQIGKLGIAAKLVLLGG